MLQEGSVFAAVTTELVSVQCWCGVWHAIPRNVYQRAKDKGEEVYCPVGHKWWFKKTEAQRLREVNVSISSQLRWANDRLAYEKSQHDQTRASLRSTEAAKTRLQKKIHRVDNGVCPHCNRSFENLRRHMETKHSKTVKEKHDE